MSKNPYESDLDANPANYAELTPIGFLERSAAVYPERTSIVHGNRRHPWAETRARCRRLASSLAARGIGRGDTVSVMAPNVPAAWEATLAVPMLGAVVNTINTRLDASTVAFILKHGEAKAIITDRELSPTVGPALAKVDRRPLVIDVDDPDAAGGDLLGEVEYEAFLAGGDHDLPEPRRREKLPRLLVGASGQGDAGRGRADRQRHPQRQQQGLGRPADHGSHAHAQIFAVVHAAASPS